MKKLSIIVPVFNEEKTVKILLTRLFSAKLPVKEVEYIIVDDHSKDKTSESISYVLALTKKKNISVYHHKENLGKGAAVRTGLEHATGDYVIIQDADLEYNPQDIAKLILKVSEKYPVVYGTRLNRLPNFREDIKTFYLIHYLGNRFLSFVTSILYHHWITDMENCYKLFPRVALKNITLKARGFEFEPEITAKLLKKGYRVAEVPISTTPRGYGEGKKIHAITDGTKALWTLIKYRFISDDEKRDKKSNNFTFIVLFILLLAIIFRFTNYHNRFILGYDQAHDALLAKYALLNHRLPLLGPFSSAGPFQTGGEWYWIIMIGTSLFPNTVLSPWIFMTILYIFFVYLSIVVAKEIFGEKYALITGFFAAISSAQIVESANLTNQAPLALISLFGIWCAVRYLKNTSGLSIFLLGLCIGLASSIHLSGVALICLAISLVIVKRKIYIPHVLLFTLGIFIPWIPVLFIDTQNNFFNTRHMFQYYLHDQYKIPLEALGRRWLTYLGIFWPTQWANIIGFSPIVGYFEILLLFLGMFIYRRYVTKMIVVLLLSVLFMIFLLRYTHTPIFDSYLVFMHPFIFLLTAWVVYIFLQIKKLVGVLLLLIISLSTLYQDYTILISPPNGNYVLINNEINSLYKNFNGQKFAVLNNNEKWKDKNYILSLFISARNDLSPDGIKISTVVATQEGEFNGTTLYGSLNNYQLLDLSNNSAAALENQGWKYVDGKTIYFDTEEWFNKSKND